MTADNKAAAAYHPQAPHEPTPSLDDFLARYDQNDNEWWYLVGGDHLNLFDEAIDRMRTAEADLAHARSAGESYRRQRDDLRVKVGRVFALADLLVEQGEHHVPGCQGQADCAACIRHDLHVALEGTA